LLHQYHEQQQYVSPGSLRQREKDQDPNHCLMLVTNSAGISSFFTPGL
jgi:hypothetical protein